MAEREETPAGEITRLLSAIRTGNEVASDRLYDLVYRDLVHQARALFRRQKFHSTLQATALVHEAWFKLRARTACNDRGHFFALAARVMRQILTDRARAASTQKRGAGKRIAMIDDDAVHGTILDIVAFDDCLEQLERLNARHAQVVELRVFGGCTIDDTAEVLGVSHSTVEADWRMARAWLRTKLEAS